MALLDVSVHSHEETPPDPADSAHVDAVPGQPPVLLAGIAAKMPGVAGDVERLEGPGATILSAPHVKLALVRLLVGDLDRLRLARHPVGRQGHDEPEHAHNNHE